MPQDNQAYSVMARQGEQNSDLWAFAVFSEGYTAVDDDGQQAPVDTLLINTKTKRLTVVKAMNGLDATEPRLKMREVLKKCWEMTGLALSDLKEVLGYKVDNDDMNKAIARCRTELKVEPFVSFDVSSKETAADRKACWDTLGTTIFSASIRGALAEFDINKELVQIKVDSGGNWDHVYYEFA